MKYLLKYFYAISVKLNWRDRATSKDLINIQLCKSVETTLKNCKFQSFYSNL